MGFDITAYDTAEELKEVTDESGEEVLDFDSVKEVAYYRTYMGGFRMLREQEYDWFKLIDAKECDCGVSGCGERKLIELTKLKEALEALLSHTPNCLADAGFDKKDMRDEFKDKKPDLEDFMGKCIAWCKKNKKEEILIYFG